MLDAVRTNEPATEGTLKDMQGRRKKRPNRRLRIQTLEPRQMLAGPSGLEQEFIQRVNRFRVDPQGELGRMLVSTSPLVARDPHVQNNLDFFEVDGNVLRSQWDQLTPVPPLAWNADLQEAATGHNALMVSTNTQSHRIGDEPPLGDRLRNAGYRFQAAAENLFAYCQSIDFCHAGLAIDWGNGPDGIQNPAGHRIHLMSETFREVGIAVQRTSNPSPRDVGPLVATQNFGTRQGLSAQVVGAVFRDTDQSGWYDAGEGTRGVTVAFVGTDGSQATATTTTMTAGGYQVELEAGTYEVTFAVGGSEFVRGGVAVDSANVWLNLDTAMTPPPAPQAARDFASVFNDQSTLLDVLANDVANAGRLNGSSLRIENRTTAGGVWENADGQLRFTPNAGAVGYYENRYRIADQSGAVSDWATVRVMVVQSQAPIWQNPLTSADVDADGQVLALDALHIINEMNRRGIGSRLPAAPGTGGPSKYVDVDGDGSVSPRDALSVINALNRVTGEGESGNLPIDTSSIVAAVDYHALESLRHTQQRSMISNACQNERERADRF